MCGQTNVCVFQPLFPENSSGFNSFLAHTNSHYAIGNVLSTCLYHVALPTGIPAPRELPRESKFSKAPFVDCLTFSIIISHILYIPFNYAYDTCTLLRVLTQWISVNTCRFYSFVIHVWHPHFTLNGMKKCLAWFHLTWFVGRICTKNTTCLALIIMMHLGAGIAQWLERRTRDRKVAGSNPCRSDGRIFFSRVNFLCWLLFRYPFQPRVTAVARKRPRSF